jgi:amino acid adenylation domain-containing protein
MPASDLPVPAEPLWALWRTDLASGQSALTPSAQSRRPTPMARGGGTLAIEFEPSLTARLRSCAEGESTTIFVVLLTVFHALIRRYTGSDESPVTMLTSGRASPALGDALRQVTDARPFAEHVASARLGVARALAGQGQSSDGEAASSSGQHVAFGFSPRAQLPPDAPHNGPASLAVRVADADDRLTGLVTYSADYEPATVERLAGAFIALAEQFSAAPGIALARADCLSARERELIAGWNRTTTGYPRERSIIELFGEHVTSAPDRPALTYGDTTLTYRQLDAVTNALARRLRRLGVGRDTRVGIHIDRDPCVIVGMLAVIKAGGAYLPLDPAHPDRFLRAVVAAAEPKVLLVKSGAGDQLGTRLPVIAVSDYLDAAVQDVQDDTAPDRGTSPDDLAYIMYTSGSSGTPKGICISHRNVIRLVRGTDYVNFRASDRVAQISNAAFDAATFEVWGALLNGAELVGFGKDVVLTPGGLAAALRDSRIDVMVMSTGLFNQLSIGDPGMFSSVRELIVGGDVMGTRQARSVASLPGCTLSNGYGPTECTTFATAYRLPRGDPDWQRVPIGHPIANTTCYVLNSLLRPQPIGVAGELYIGGDGLGRGYLNSPALTACKFIPDPFAPRPGQRMYATGDLARWRPDGCLEFLGRADSQVKIRGFRIELGEVDAVLAGHPRVGEAVTIVLGDQAEEKILVCYYTVADDDDLDAADVVAFLRERLPGYMIPSRLVPMAELPKNANSKIDRSGLAQRGVADTQPATESATGPLLGEVSALFAELLQFSSVGPDENFFDIGGHSLLAAKLLACLLERFDADMTLSDLFDDPTARGIAARVDARNR